MVMVDTMAKDLLMLSLAMLPATLTEALKVCLAMEDTVMVDMAMVDMDMVVMVMVDITARDLLMLDTMDMETMVTELPEASSVLTGHTQPMESMLLTHTKVALR